jgi:WD40 repeat protein/GTPase SAR1 family protein
MSTLIRNTRRITFPKKVNRVRWSADGCRLITAGQEHLLRTWDITFDEKNSQEIEEFWLTEDVQRRRRAGSIKLATSARGEYFASVLPNHPHSLQVRSIDGDDRVLWESKLFNEQINAVTWSSVDDMLAVGADEYTVYVLDGRTGETWRTLDVDAAVSCLAFSPDGRYLAVGTFSNPQPYIQIWDLRRERMARVLRGHSGSITSLAWWPDAEENHLLASGSMDFTVRIWTWTEGNSIRLEQHTRPITHLSVSVDGSVLASASSDESVCLWSRNRAFEMAYILSRPGSTYDPCEVAFHPHKPLLAMIEEDVHVTVTSLDLDLLHDGSLREGTAYYYSTAKVVVVGDGTVGKTSLCHALRGAPFKPRFGTHGVNMWRIEAPRGQYRGKEVHRELYLWDLAGQGEYQLIHQLYLTNLSAALLVFAQNSKNNPFRGLRHWNQILRQVEARDNPNNGLNGNFEPSALRKFLVQARVDLLGSRVFQDEIDERQQEFGCLSFHRTSAQTREGIRELQTALVNGIDWGHITQNISTLMFETITRFLEWVQESPDVQILPSKQLYQMFLEKFPNAPRGAWLRRQFDTCISFLEARQLLRRFDFGNLILLRPELLHYYASSIIAAARENDRANFGQVPESAIVHRQIPIPEEKRIQDPEEEQWMLIATMQDLLRFEVAIMDEGMLIFPSHFAEARDRLLAHEGLDKLIYTFTGAVLNLYAVLIVRLSRTNLFHIRQLAENKAQFLADEGGLCGITLVDDDEEAKLIVYFDEGVSHLTRYTFDMFIYRFLKQQAFGGIVTRTYIYHCTNPNCPSEKPVRFDPENVNQRLQMGKRDIRCPVCDEFTQLDETFIDAEMKQVLNQRIKKMNKLADREREQQAAETIHRAKEALDYYDVYFEGAAAEAAAIQSIVQELRKRGIRTLTERRTPDEIAETVKTVVFFVGDHGLDEKQITAWKGRVKKYLANELTVVFAMYSVQSLPDELLKLKEVQIIYFFDNLQDRSPISELMMFITGKTAR